MTTQIRSLRSVPRTSRELLFESLYVGIIGGSAVALFFLLVDLLNGQPLHTPHLIGNTILRGSIVPSSSAVQLNTIIVGSIFHICAFVALGAAMSLVVHRVELRSKHPVAVFMILFALIEAAFFAIVPLVAPGLITALGIGKIAIANLLAAGSMSLFYLLSHRAGEWQAFQHSSGDLIFDSLYAGAIGGSVVALFFMALDLLRGQPMLTPSLVGSVLFFDTPANEVSRINFTAIAYLSMLHMAGFALVGALLSWLVHEVELHARHPFEILLVAFVVTEAAFFTIAPIVLPGVVGILGIVPIGIANLLAAFAIACFFVLSHRESAWQDFKKASHLA